MNVGTSGSILINSRDAKCGAILANAVPHVTGNLRQWSGMVAKSLVSRDGDGLIRSPDALRARAERTTVGLVIGGDEVIHAAYLIHVVSLAHGIALRDNDTLGRLDGTTHVCLQLRTLHLAIAVDGINLTIVVEEHGEVVDASLHVVMLPWTMDVLRGVALQTLAVDVCKDIKLSVGIANGRCPHALTINLLVVFQREGIVRKVKAVKAIADILPVDKILGVQDNETRHRVHSSASQIVVIPYPQDIGVGELVVEQRISKCAIAIVCRPTLRDCVAKY